MSFSQVFAQKEHPLVIFQDDLQWADSQTLELIEMMIRDNRAHHLFFIGAYRDNEMDKGHLLMKILGDLEKVHTIEHISLEPLNLEHINHLIADALHCPPPKAKPLTQLVHEKTLGNPFFVNMFLNRLYQDDLIRFNFSASHWEYDLKKIEGTNITDNVVTLMLEKINQLPSETQHVLSLAASIGNKFDLKILGLINNQAVHPTMKQLWPAIEQGLIVPLDSAYQWINEDQSPPLKIPFRFLHDRVQQAAYSLIDLKDVGQLHLRVGRLLYKNMAKDELQEHLFEVVDHMNLGMQLIEETAEKKYLAELNYLTAKKAKSSSSYDHALSYVKSAIKCLSVQPWQDNYELTYSIFLEKGQLEYLMGKEDK